MKTHNIFLAILLTAACILSSEASWAQGKLESRLFETSDGIKLHYLEAGSGPSLVFVPGWTMPAWIWEPQLSHFSANYRVVALDPRGQGSSEKPSQGYHADRRGRDICELLEHLGDEPAVVVGWSLAVQEALVCAHEVGTEHIRALVLVDHPVLIAPQDALAIADERVKSLQLNREASVRRFVEGILNNPPSEAYVEALTRAALSTPANAAAIMMADLYFLGPTDLRPLLDALDRPVLFVFSSLDWALAAANEIREGWPEVPVKVMDGASHALFVDKPQEFNSVLKEFLASLPK
jgi:microsomal epoxide hydrolase